MPKETMGKTIAVAAGVCVVCSVFVSTAAVYLKPFQERNKTLEKMQNILMAADVGLEGDLDELFKEEIDARWIYVESGEFVEEKDIPVECLDEKKAAKNPDPKCSQGITDDLAGLKRRAKYRQIYLRRKGGQIDTIILPVHGKGLWSTMYGFLALDRDTTTIKSFTFYEHGETPGLGGEIDNPKWKSSWVDKKAFDDAWQPRVKVAKGKAAEGDVHEMDGLSGATLTARGVEKLVQFWLGDEGYGPFLAKLRTGDHDG
jgi:Na+-transporting NADH:ubiquinone oxidoreductase subunit C